MSPNYPNFWSGNGRLTEKEIYATRSTVLRVVWDPSYYAASISSSVAIGNPAAIDYKSFSTSGELCIAVDLMQTVDMFSYIVARRLPSDPS